MNNPSIRTATRVVYLGLIAAWFATVPHLTWVFSAYETGNPELVELRRAVAHPMQYFLALPRGYGKPQEDRRWPILVCIDGAARMFEQRVNDFRNARGDLPFILVAPCTFSNTNRIEGSHRERYLRLYSDEEIRQAETDRLSWDEAGLLAVLDDIRKEFGSEDRISLTGFSGGGLLTYRMLLRHPERVAAAVPVCANFFGDPVAQTDEKPSGT